MSALPSRTIQKWGEISAEERRRIGVGITTLLFVLVFLVAYLLTTQSLNKSAFEFMLEIFPGSSTKFVSVGPENRDEIASLKRQLEKLAPQSPYLKAARSHLLKALTYLYEELEAEGEFAHRAQNREFGKAAALSKKAEERRQSYLAELRLAKAYVKRYTQETGKPAINIQLPE